jgi:hypothetical protein
MSYSKFVSIIIAISIIIYAGCTQKNNDQLILFDPDRSDVRLVKSTNEDDITISDGKVKILFGSGEQYPVISFYPEKGVWDASGYRFVRCEIENMGSRQQLVELGFGDYDLTLGATIVPARGKKILKAIVYRTNHPAYIDSVFPIMQGKPEGSLRGWMASTCDSIEFIKLLFPVAQTGDLVRVGRIWLEGSYVLLSEDELKDKYYPFVDEFGQYMFADWPDKIHSEADLKLYNEKEDQDLSEHPGCPEWNEYGGWAGGPQLKATGHFRVEKYNGKWWFVDPTGKLFWSQGLDCVEFGTQSQTKITDCEKYFSYLPAEGSKEADLYTSRPIGNQTNQMLSFHAVNLYRKYGESWRDISNDRIHQRMRSWGMNTIANWSDKNIYLKHRTPYVLTVNTIRTGEITDPYASGFQQDLENLLKSKKEELQDPWCLGVFVDNELKWGVKWADKIPEHIQVAPENQPAKLVYLEKIKEKYKNINELNKAWGTSFDDWTGFLRNENVIPEAAADMREFMKEFTSKYYASCRDAIRKTAPEMLYLGCRMDFHMYPEDTSLNYIIKIASEYCDVVSFNRYRYTCSELVPPDDGDYPIIIGEFHFGSMETGLLQPGLRYAADPVERAELYEFYVNNAITNPYIVGTHWFQLVDQSVTGRSDGENYQAGFLTVGDVPQNEIIEKARYIGYNMYRIRSEGNK